MVTPNGVRWLRRWVLRQSSATDQRHGFHEAPCGALSATDTNRTRSPRETSLGDQPGHRDQDSVEYQTHPQKHGEEQNIAHNADGPGPYHAFHPADGGGKSKKIADDFPPQNRVAGDDDGGVETMG